MAPRYPIVYEREREWWRSHYWILEQLGDERSRQVIEMRYALGKQPEPLPLERIAELIDRTAERVRQVTAEAKAKVLRFRRKTQSITIAELELSNRSRNALKNYYESRVTTVWDLISIGEDSLWAVPSMGEVSRADVFQALHNHPDGPFFMKKERPF
jgi:hypothetical protein